MKLVYVCPFARIIRNYDYEHEGFIHVGGTVEFQLRLREETIYSLKQEMASLREKTDSTIFILEERIKEQMSEIEELRHQVGNQKEGDITFMAVFIHISCNICCRLTTEGKPLALKTELKVEPHTILEGEPHALLSVKREIKEEAVPMTCLSTGATAATRKKQGELGR